MIHFDDPRGMSAAAIVEASLGWKPHEGSPRLTPCGSRDGQANPQCLSDRFVAHATPLLMTLESHGNGDF
jgi:hypothetical protein